MIQSVTIQNRGFGVIQASGKHDSGIRLSVISDGKNRKCFVRHTLVHPMKPSNIYYNDFMELFKILFNSIK